jgi:3-oxoacyl-[acyl-carrier protein] reductase
VSYTIDLSGHRALVTGSGQGVGRGIALTLAEAGAEVVVNDLVLERASDVVAEIENAGGKASAAAFDVGDWAAVQDAVTASGPFDVLVNNAGNAGRAMTMTPDDLQMIVNTQPEDWEPFFRVNLYGVMYAVRAVLPSMVDAGWGRIVTVISDSARTGETHMAAYAAAKAGAAGFSRCVAKEVGRNGITVNCVSLGTMRVDRPGHPDPTPEQEALAASLMKRYVIRRQGKAEDVASLVTFLASPEASWITGQTVPVNGGYSMAL